MLHYAILAQQRIFIKTGSPSTYLKTNLCERNDKFIFTLYNTLLVCIDIYIKLLKQATA